jgi:polysaccharide export outer membrane protein
MNRLAKGGWLAVGAMVVLAGWAQAKGPQESAAKPASGTVPSDKTYIIGPADVLNINVWKEPDVSRTVPVRPDGKISLPLLNDVQAAGLTPMQLQGTVTKELEKFISDPQVTVIVTEVNSRRVYVLGEVARPGAMTMLPHMTVLQALSTAGGLGQFAKMNGIYVLRTENGRQVTFPFHYKDVVRGKNAQENIELKPGDTIVVP